MTNDGECVSERIDEAVGTLQQMKSEGHENVAFFYDDKTGLKAIVAIHSSRLGPALGGCRVWPYESEAEALKDVLRLSKGMTYKNAAMGLPLGGGKAVIIASKEQKTPELFEAFGRAVATFGGRYVTAQDVGTSSDDLLAIRKGTEHVVGLPGAGGDPSPVTARGVLGGMKAALEHVYGTDSLEGRTVAVQGLGAVGMHLCRNLHAEGAKLVVTDIDEGRVRQAVQEFGAEATTTEGIYDVDCDVYAPCALGGTLNDDTIPRLKAAIVAGSANNQLGEDRHGDMLKERNIVYAPDFVINGGGVINVFNELVPGGYDQQRAFEQVDGIRAKVAEALDLAKEHGVNTNTAAVMMADRTLQAEA